MNATKMVAAIPRMKRNKWSVCGYPERPHASTGRGQPTIGAATRAAFGVDADASFARMYFAARRPRGWRVRLPQRVSLQTPRWRSEGACSPSHPLLPRPDTGNPARRWIYETADLDHLGKPGVDRGETSPRPGP